MTFLKVFVLTFATSTVAGCGANTALWIRNSVQTPAWTPSLAVHHGWMSSHAKQEDLIYVGMVLSPSGVFVYDYKTGAMVGERGGFNFEGPGGMCVDTLGDVWITSTGTAQIVEYAHGSDMPLQTLSTDQNPIGCSVSPNGDLAVTNYMSTHRFSTIQVWKHASGTPTTYSLPQACYFMFPPGYDNKGNLYIETQNNICALPAGASGLKVVPFDKKINYPIGVMWDGKYITLADQRYDGGYTPAIYRAVRTASGGLRSVGVTLLQYAPSETDSGGQPFFVGKKNTPANDQQSKVFIDYYSSYLKTWVEYYHYESGVPFRSFPSSYSTSGQAVSLAAQH